jgi:replication factor C large subunit
MRRQQFGLWGYATELMAGGVSTAKTQRYGAPPMYRFPGWIRQMGATKGSRGVRERLGEKLGARLHTSVDVFVRDVLPDLRAICVQDSTMAESLGVQADLDEDELRFLLGPKVSSAVADEVVAHVEKRRAEAASQSRFEAHEAPPAKPSRSRGLNLGDF